MRVDLVGERAALRPAAPSAVPATRPVALQLLATEPPTPEQLLWLGTHLAAPRGTAVRIVVAAGERARLGPLQGALAARGVRILPVRVEGPLMQVLADLETHRDALLVVLAEAPGRPGRAARWALRRCRAPSLVVPACPPNDLARARVRASSEDELWELTPWLSSLTLPSVFLELQGRPRLDTYNPAVALRELRRVELGLELARARLVLQGRQVEAAVDLRERRAPCSLLVEGRPRGLAARWFGTAAERSLARGGPAVLRVPSRAYC